MQKAAASESFRPMCLDVWLCKTIQNSKKIRGLARIRTKDLLVARIMD